MKKYKVTKPKKEREKGFEGDSKTEGIVGMLISLHTFPLESAIDLETKKGVVTELMSSNNIK